MCGLEIGSLAPIGWRAKIAQQTRYITGVIRSRGDKRIYILLHCVYLARDSCKEPDINQSACNDAFIKSFTSRFKAGIFGVNYKSSDVHVPLSY